MRHCTVRVHSFRHSQSSGTRQDSVGAQHAVPAKALVSSCQQDAAVARAGSAAGLKVRLTSAIAPYA
jgi:hypothetical protein